MKISDLCLVQKYGRTREANCPTPLESHQTYADFYQNLWKAERGKKDKTSSAINASVILLQL